MRAIIILSFLLICLGCSPSKKDTDNPEPLESDIIVTSFYPTTYFAERISGGLVPVVCLLPEDEDPIYWKPSSDAIVQFQAASLVILNGAEFEKWPNFVSLPLLSLIHI